MTRSVTPPRPARPVGPTADYQARLRSGREELAALLVPGTRPVVGVDRRRRRRPAGAPRPTHLRLVPPLDPVRHADG